MEAATCPICLGTVFPAEEVSVSMCQPVAHFCHLDCWKAQTEDQKLRCTVCRQREVGEYERILICEVFGVEAELEVVEQLPMAARQLLRAWQHDQIDDLDAAVPYKWWI